MKTTKIGIICPLGPLDRYGYQYNHLITLENLSSFATRVYLCSSTRSQTDVDRLLARFPKVEYISDKRTWFDADSNGNEIFSIARLESNSNLMIERCKRDQMDCAVMIHINQYIQYSVKENLRQLCQDMLAARRPFEWLYKKYQLGNRLFHADTRVPWILNLQIDNPFLIQADSIHHRNGNERYTIQNGNFRDKDYFAIVDCPLELTLQDLADIKNFTRCYSELNPQASPIFDWNKYFYYCVWKINAKFMSDEPLDATGEAIVRNSRKDFLSWIFLEQYKKSNSTFTIDRYIRLGLFYLRDILKKISANY